MKSASTLPGLLTRLVVASLSLLLFGASPAWAEEADIDAAVRGVVRIVIIERDGDEAIPISHATGFAVGPERVVTNAHVVAQVRADKTLYIGIVPSDGGSAVYGEIAAYSPRNDLALIRTTTPMNLPPLTIAAATESYSQLVWAIGYPVTVDRAQGLGLDEIYYPQPPVRSRGFLSGRRPTRDFDTLLHTVPIARGNSGGPLLDDCGRVIGVNSFGAEAGGTDAEFYFAVSTRELLPFLRENNVPAAVNGLPCRSIAQLDAAERTRAERENAAAQRLAEAERSRLAAREALARRNAEFSIIDERDNAMMLALLLAVSAIVAGRAGVELRRSGGDPKRIRLAAALSAVALVGSIASWLSRPGFDEVEDRVAEALTALDQPGNSPSGVIFTPGSGTLTCEVNIERSRITGGSIQDVPFSWSPDGCVNNRTQYGLVDGNWTRILVPRDEAVVSVNSYDPKKREFRVERFLLGSEAMKAARKARSDYDAPVCGGGESAARALGSGQQAIADLLPEEPNERLIYDCKVAE